MPRLKRISVSVVTPEGRLPSLGTEFSSSNFCESYILSQADSCFWVSIKPDNDFFPLRSSSKNASPATSLRKPNLTHARDGRLKDYVDFEGKKKLEWHLLAMVFLDDREIPETSSIVYLPWDDKVKERTIKGRIAFTADGRSIERRWYFKELGLENFLNPLSVVDTDADGDLAATGAEEHSGASEVELQEMMQSLGTGNGEKKTSKVGKIGQIRVELLKIIITRSSKDYNYRPELLDEGEQQVPRSTGGVSHSARVGEAINITFSPTRKTFRQVEPEPYATFVFNYRSDEELRRIKLLDAPGTSHRKLDKLVPFLTPLTFNTKPKPTKSSSESRPRFSGSGFVSSLNDPGGDRGVKGSPTLEAPKSDVQAARDANLDNGFECGLGLVNGDYEPSPPISNPGGQLSTTETEHQREVALIVSAARNIILSSPADSQALVLCVSPPSDAGDKGNFEADTCAPLAIMDSEDREIIQLGKPETDEPAENLALKLQIAKRGYSSEGDDCIDFPGEDGGQSERQTKRPRRIKNQEDGAGHEVM